MGTAQKLEKSKKLGSIIAQNMLWRYIKSKIVM